MHGVELDGVLGWNHQDIVGRAAGGQKRFDQRLVAIKQTGKSPPPRAGYLVYVGDEEVGKLTSGGVSPALQCGISLGYLKAGFNKRGTAVDVEIRGKRYPAEIVVKPFV